MLPWDFDSCIQKISLYIDSRSYYPSSGVPFATSQCGLKLLPWAFGFYPLEASSLPFS